MLNRMSYPKFVVQSLPTLDHLDPAFIALDPRRPGASAWYITTNPNEAHHFSEQGAIAFARQLQHDGVSCGLVNDGHRWAAVPK